MLRKTIGALLGATMLLGQVAQAASPTSQNSISGDLVQPQPIGLLACHLDLETGIAECQAAPQHDAHVQAWQRHLDQPTITRTRSEQTYGGAK